VVKAPNPAVRGMHLCKGTIEIWELG